MIVRVEQNHGDHINFYESPHVGIHKLMEVGGKEVDGLQLILDIPKAPVTIDLVKDNMTRVFIMNDQGKTIDTHYI